MRDVSNFNVSAPLHGQDMAVTDALARLRRNRWKQNNGDLKRVGRRSSSKITTLSCMTLTDQQFCSGSIADFVHIGQRQIGILTDAEHFGRLGL